MAYIYKVYNNINDKLYIGQTARSLEKRWKEHLNHADNKTNAPLYLAMNKYGKENFFIELIEETDFPDEREIYWISYYNTYGNNGYNATLGGQGIVVINKQLVFSLWQKGFSLEEIAMQLNRSKSAISYILHQNEITFEEIRSRARKGKFLTETHLKVKKLWDLGKATGEIANELQLSTRYVSGILNKMGITGQERNSRRSNRKPVYQIDKNTNEIIKMFSSIQEAENILQIKNISSVCSGRRNTAGGYKWKYAI